MSRKNLLPAWLVLICGVFPPIGSATEYSVRAVVEQRGFYDGNLAMIPDPSSASQDLRDKHVSGYELAPQLTLRARSQRWDLRLNTELRFSRLSDQLFDSDDQTVDLAFSRSGPNSQWSVAAAVDRDSSRSSVEELGFILAASRTERYSFSPRWTRNLSERDGIALGGSWSKVDYDQARFSDYEYYSVDVTWLRQLSEKNELQLSAYRSDFDSGERPFNRESETLGMSVAFNRQLNESLSTNFSIGARQVDTTTRALVCTEFFLFFCLRQELRAFEDDSNGVTAAGGLDYKAEAWSLSASVSRSLIPNGAAGQLYETDTVRVRYLRQLGPTLAVELIGQVTSEEELDTSSFSRDRLRLQPRVRWQFSERWSLVSSLIFRSRDQQFGVFQSDADGTIFSVRVRYEHPRAQWSR